MFESNRTQHFARTARRRMLQAGAGLLAAAALVVGLSVPALAAPGDTHTVVPGDTLSEIAEQYGVPLSTLFELNGLTANSVIYPGNRIRLSTAGGEDAVSVPQAGPAYTVRPGDTLGRIAAAHGISLDTVLELNGLSRSSIIYPGDTIRLGPGEASDAGAGSGGSAGAPGPGLFTGPNGTSRVVLTFDDCPGSLDRFTEVVSWAGANGIGLVIAPTGDCIRGFSARHGVDLAQLARAHGQYVINHSVSHRDLTTLGCAGAAAELGSPGVVTNYGRPPYGALDGTARCGYASVGMTPWLWSVDTRDWTGKSEAQVVESVVSGAQPGGTVLMHLQWNGFRTSALAAMHDGLAARGLELCRAFPGTSPVELPNELPC